ncbi:MAG TPA: PAS domain S-box protein, partial [Paludibacter sp.]
NATKGNALEENADIVSRLQDGEVVRYEVEHYHKDGHVIPLSVTASMIDIDARFYLGFYQDITERKEAEAAIKKKMADLEWLNNISVGRELTMIELKKEINELLKRLGEEPKYEISK